MAGAEKSIAANDSRIDRQVQQIASRVFRIIADAFPVAASSDEFGYFPQVIHPRTRWDSWDSFYPEGVAEAVAKLQAECAAMRALLPDGSDAQTADQQLLVDMALVLETVETLVEQLTIVRAWELQPTWHLTIICVGLAEALEYGENRAASRRAAGLADFIDRSTSSLQRIPALFRDLGMEMIAGTRRFLADLHPTLPELTPALHALDRFEDTVARCSVHRHFQLPGDLFERVLRSHLHLQLDCQQLADLLAEEIEHLRKQLEQVAGAPLDAAGLDRYIRRSPPPPAQGGGLLELYKKEVASLARHCVRAGLVTEEMVSQCPVRVEPVPAYLSAIRAASSYSIPARHPPIGGVFYVINAYEPAERFKTYQREYRILAAHETYPGHHLLDVHRWSLPQAIRRVIERPLFYEGWACFAEELIRLTGYLQSPHELLLLLRRRLWRAIRGQIDLGLQTGGLDLPAAASLLMQTGMNRSDAMASARKYPLNPGYQSCYTAGIQRFLGLYDRFGRSNLPIFVETILRQGEIGFDSLAAVLAAGPESASGADSH